MKLFHSCDVLTSFEMLTCKDANFHTSATDIFTSCYQKRRKITPALLPPLAYGYLCMLEYQHFAWAHRLFIRHNTNVDLCILHPLHCNFEDKLLVHISGRQWRITAVQKIQLGKSSGDCIENSCRSTKMCNICFTGDKTLCIRSVLRQRCRD